VRLFRRILLGSSFFIVVLVLAFVLYPVVLWLVQFINDGVSEGSGYYNPYTRFVPASFEDGLSLALDLGLSAFGAAALFYGLMRIKRQNPRTTEAAIAGKEPPAKSARLMWINHRLWLIPVWLIARYIWNAIDQGSLVRGFEKMTSLESLWVTFIVIIAILYYASKKSELKNIESKK
jgi:hypothetical protein